MANRRGNGGNSDRFPLLGLSNDNRWWLQPWNQMIASWQESYDKLDKVLKSRDITLPTKVHTVKALVFPAVMHGGEGWTVKKAEHQRTDAFKLWCWRRLLRVAWTARRLSQSLLREIGSEYSLEGFDVEAKTPVFWSSDANSWLIRKVPDAGNDWGKMEKRVSKDEMARWHHWCNAHELRQTSGDGEGQGPSVLQSMVSQRVGHNWATEQQQWLIKV